MYAWMLSERRLICLLNLLQGPIDVASIFHVEIFLVVITLTSLEIDRQCELLLSNQNSATDFLCIKDLDYAKKCSTQFVEVRVKASFRGRRGLVVFPR